MPRNLKNWLKGYLEYTRYSESPDLFHFWTGVSTIAGALRRQVWIDERYFEWTPNFYIVLVGPPGIAAKSTSMRSGLDLLGQVPGIHFGPNSMTWQALTEALQGANELVPIGDENDPLNQKFIPMSCITCPVSELGTFLRPDDGELVDVLVDLWDGQIGEWRRSTKTQGETKIVNPWINVIGCTTPAWLKANFPEVMVGGGLTSRIVFVYGDEKRHLVPYPSSLIAAEKFEEERQILIDDLREIAMMRGQYELTPEARALGSVWYEEHWTKKPVHMASEKYQGYMARKQTHVHKLAMVVAAAQRSELFISEDDLATAFRFITGLEHDMAKVFESIGVANTGKMVSELVGLVRAYKQIPQKELWRLCMKSMSLRDFQETTDAAVRAGMLRIVQEGSLFVYYPVNEPEEKRPAIPTMH